MHVSAQSKKYTRDISHTFEHRIIMELDLQLRAEVERPCWIEFMRSLNAHKSWS